MIFKKKKILIAVTGSIAAYKSLLLVRLLIKAGAEVKVIMSESATAFVSPLSFSTLSKNEVHTSVIDGDAWNNHVDLGLWSDLMIVAPCTATTMAKMANGIADSIVTAVYLSAKCPVFVAPAMDRDMWIHPSSQNNLAKLTSYGNIIIPVEEGELASGLEGKGRMAEPENIMSFLKSHLSQEQDLSGYNVLITAGPTYEAMDPVRFIGNNSSGKMGIALASKCALRGAKVNLILGPTSQSVQNENINVVRVTTADQMCKAVLKLYSKTDIAILAAAVADYRPKTKSKTKIKKKDDDLSLELERTVDIAATIGKKKKPNQINIGFALETNNEVKNALGKIERKNFDFIVLNSLRDKGAGFKADTNKITILDNTGNKKAFPLKSKLAVANDIIDYLVEYKLGC